MTLALALFALAPLISNDRVTVWEAAPAATAEHDAVVVDPGTRTARFVQQGEPLMVQGRAVVVELLAKPVGALPNKTGLPDAFDRPGIEKLLDNDRVTVWRYAWQPKKRTPMHFHAKDTVVVFTADGALASITPDGKSVLNAHTFGMTRFSPSGRVHQEELARGEASAVMVELK